MEKAGIDRLRRCYTRDRRGPPRRHDLAHRRLRRHDRPAADDELFDKQMQLRMGQANVKRWVDDILPLLTDDVDPLGVDDFATHRCRSRPRPTRTSCSRRNRTAQSRSC